METPPRLTSTPPRKAVFMLMLSALCATQEPCAAQTSGLASLADKETARRAELVQQQAARLLEGKRLLDEGKTVESLAAFEEAWQTLPDVPMAKEFRALALDGYVTAGCRRAGDLVKAGDYPAARTLLDKLDSAAAVHGDARIRKARELMNDPDRHPPALTPAHISKVEQVSKLLVLANSQVETGQFNAALQSYEDVLRLDPYNTAARRGMERVEQERARYFESARDHGRAKMLNDVNRAWEAEVPVKNLSGMFGGQEGAAGAQQAGTRNGREAIQKKLRELIISQVDFSEASLEEVLEYLRVRTRDLDPAGKGVDFVVSVPADHPARPVSLNLREVPVEEVLRYVADMAGVTYKVDNFAVRLVSLADDSAEIISKSYRVPPDFISSSPVGAGADPAGSNPDPFAAGNTQTAGAPQLRRIGAKEFLEGQGVSFPEGSGASFNPSSSTLIVRNTAKNMEMVDMLVEQAFNRSPRQVVIEVKLLEVANNRLEELGFDWLLGGFGGEVVGAGGTVGNAQQANYLTGDFPQQVATAAGTTALGFNPVTAGLRSSGDLPTNTVDSVLSGVVTPTSRRSPGVLSLSGVMTSPQFQGVMRALDQKKGVDLAAQPSVVTRSGQKASIEITRELIYPTEFDPPQVPTSVGQFQLGNVIIITPPPPPVVTPTTPTAFDMRRTGVVLEVEPVISEDGRSVDLAVTPEFTEFVGFVNYGTPIFGAFQGVRNMLTENFIMQPIFETKKVVTAVNVHDGATVVLGGLVSDNNVIIQDKVPLLGDAPYVGRMFKSEVKQRQVKHVVFFVTVKVVDPSGQRVNQ